MKTYLLILLVALVSGCSSGGSGGDARSPDNANNDTPPVDLPIDEEKPKPPAPTPKPILEVGVNIHLDRGPGVALMKQMGANWVRIDMNWSIMEPTQGHWDFQVFDDVVALAARNGQKVFAGIGYTPAWASASGKEGAVPDVNQWRTFVQTAVSRYKNQVAAFGIWNEPNLEQFWNGTAAQYVDVLLKPACQVIRGIDPKIVIAGPDLAHLYSSTIEIGSFYKTLRDKNAFSCIDIITHHIYGGGDFQQRLTGFSFLGITYKNGLKQWFESAGVWGRKAWITEFGHDVMNGKSTEADQAKWTVDNIRVMSENRWIERAFIFEMTDPVGPNVPYNYGLTRADGSIRPVYNAVKQFITTNLQ